MLEENNDIIIVDDEENDVERLAKVFYDYGIGCRSFVYDPVDLIEKPLENVKLAFFDISLQTAGNNTELFAILCDALKAYISIENKAFVLVFWTSKLQVINEFQDYVNRREDKDMPKPIAIRTIDKHEFIDKHQNLKNTLSSLLDDPIVRCLFSFESQLKFAANQSLYDVLGLIDFPDQWGKSEQYIENIKNVFAKIATETLGNKRGNKNPDLAIKEAFGPLFLHYLCDSDDNVWRQFFGTANLAKIKGFSDPGIVAKLNTIFHIDTSPNKENDSRGSVRKMERLNDTFVQLFNNKIGCTPENWIYSVLLKNTKIEGDILEMVALEYSAACDYSNDKKRTHRYMLGAIIPVEVANQLAKIKLGDAIFEVPFKFFFEERECVLYLHFNYSINEEETYSDKLLGDRLFSLKKEVMNMVCDRHSNYISRIGITSFR